MRHLLLIIVVIRVTSVNAQQTFRSLEEVWAYADKHGVQVLVGSANQTIAEKNIGQAYGALWPTITANGSFTDNIQIQPTLVPGELFGGEPGTYKEEQFGKRYVYNASITAQLDLINTKNWFAIKSARYSYESAALSLTKAKYDLYAQTANAYYTYQLMDEASTLSLESLSISNETYHNVLSKYKEGQVSEVTLNTAQINLKKATISLNTAAQNKLIALNNLKQLLDLSPQDFLSLEQNAAMLSLPSQDTQFAFSPAPDVKLAYSDLLLAKTNLQSARASYTPDLSAIYSAGKQIAGDNFFDFDNTSNLPQQYWGLRLTIPILAGNSRSFQTTKTRIEFDTKQRQYESAVKKSEVNDQNLIAAYSNAFTSFAEAKKILELYRQNDLHANHKLNEGLISVDDRLRTYQDFIIYQNEYLQTMSEYFIQYYNMLIRQKTF